MGREEAVGAEEFGDVRGEGVEGLDEGLWGGWIGVCCLQGGSVEPGCVGELAEFVWES